MKEGSLAHTENSPTAATVGNRLFPNSGVMTYRVGVQGPMGLTNVDVEAATGDEAAIKALESYPGAKVTLVVPAPHRQEADVE
jgi:hypothetical protein